MSHALVTGSSGFIGQHLVVGLKNLGWQVSTVSRKYAVESSGADEESYPDLDAAPLDRVDVVFHLAGIAHAGVREESDLTAVNVDATVRAYEQCMAAGVGRFVWLSSIKVLGEHADQPLKVDAPLAPVDKYAQSKARGEQALLAALQQNNFERERLAIVRPVLVYGEGAKANFLTMLRWSQAGWPLPLANAQAGRAWVGIQNLISLLALVGEKDLQGQLIWHVCDDEQTSVRDMLKLMASISDTKCRLWPLPIGLLRFAAAILGKRQQAARVLNAMLVDVSESKRLLGWQPVQTQREAVTEVVEWYRSQS